VRQLFAREWADALRAAGVSAAVIGLLELPLLLDLAMHPGKGTSSPLIVNSVVFTATHPRTLRVAGAFRALSDACAYILLSPWMFRWFASLLVVCAGVTIYRTGRNVTLTCATVGPLVCAVVGFSFWQLPGAHCLAAGCQPHRPLSRRLGCPCPVAARDGGDEDPSATGIRPARAWFARNPPASVRGSCDPDRIRAAAFH